MSRQSSIQRNPSGFAISDSRVEIGSVSNWPSVLGIVGDVLSLDLRLLLWKSQARIIFHQAMRFKGKLLKTV